jgi:hypothetical protein
MHVTLQPADIDFDRVRLCSPSSVSERRRPNSRVSLLGDIPLPCQTGRRLRDKTNQQGCVCAGFDLKDRGSITPDSPF